MAQAKEQGVELVGPNGLLNQLIKNVLETALDAEMTKHLGYDKHDPVGRGSGNSRNGTRAQTVLTEIGPVEIEVPRDTNSSFDVFVRDREGDTTTRVSTDSSGVQGNNNSGSNDQILRSIGSRHASCRDS